MEEKIIKKLIQLGTSSKKWKSLGVVVPHTKVKQLGLLKGDYVEITVSKVN